MSIFSRLFKKEPDPVAERANKLITEFVNNAKKPMGGAKSALRGAELRERIFSIIEKVEAETGETAIAFVSGEGHALMVKPILEEEIRKQPDGALLESIFSSCFATEHAKEEYNSQWPTIVRNYRKKPNTDEVLADKSFLLAGFIARNLDIATDVYYALKNESAPALIANEQDVLIKLEEAALWYRIIDERAFTLLGQKRLLFMDHFQDGLSLVLALQGYPPDAICHTFSERIKEYGQYRKWIPDANEGAKDTLFWEAAKNIGRPLSVHGDPIFLMGFAEFFIEKLPQALVYELMTGHKKAT